MSEIRQLMAGVLRCGVLGGVGLSCGQKNVHPAVSGAPAPVEQVDVCGSCVGEGHHRGVHGSACSGYFFLRAFFFLDGSGLRSFLQTDGLERPPLSLPQGASIPIPRVSFRSKSPAAPPLGHLPVQTSRFEYSDHCLPKHWKPLAECTHHREWVQHGSG